MGQRFSQCPYKPFILSQIFRTKKSVKLAFLQCKVSVSGEKFTAFDEFSSDMYKNVVIKKAFSQLINQ